MPEQLLTVLKLQTGQREGNRRWELLQDIAVGFSWGSRVGPGWVGRLETMQLRGERSPKQGAARAQGTAVVPPSLWSSTEQEGAVGSVASLLDRSGVWIRPQFGGIHEFLLYRKMCQGLTITKQHGGIGGSDLHMAKVWLSSQHPIDRWLDVSNPLQGLGTSAHTSLPLPALPDTGMQLEMLPSIAKKWPKNCLTASSDQGSAQRPSHSRNSFLLTENS